MKSPIVPATAATATLMRAWRVHCDVAISHTAQPSGRRPRNALPAMNEKGRANRQRATTALIRLASLATPPSRRSTCTALVIAELLYFL